MACYAALLVDSFLLPKAPATPKPLAAAQTKPLAVAHTKRGPVAEAATPSSTVYSHVRNDKTGLITLLGTYAEKGINHGKKYYHKIERIEGFEDLKVFLYFWDHRDGATGFGWWFDKGLGTSDVWARNTAASAMVTPPRARWRVPYDAELPEVRFFYVGTKPVDGVEKCYKYRNPMKAYLVHRILPSTQILDAKR